MLRMLRCRILNPEAPNYVKPGVAWYSACCFVEAVERNSRVSILKTLQRLGLRVMKSRVRRNGQQINGLVHAIFFLNPTWHAGRGILML